MATTAVSPYIGALYQSPGFYAGTGLAKLLNANKQYYAWQNQPGQAAVGKASVAFQLERQKSAFYPFGVSYEILFSGAPGAFDVDIQHADTDADVNYVTVNSVSSVNSNNAARVELPACYAKFCRVKLVSLANAVNLTVLVTR